MAGRTPPPRADTSSLSAQDLAADERDAPPRLRRGGLLALCLYELDATTGTLFRARRQRRGATRVSGSSADPTERWPPFIHETARYKSLHFSFSEAQSRMLKRDPHTLVVDYTRTMMGFLLFQSQPQHIAMIGLGGGSLAKFCHLELPQSRIDVVEVNPHVIALRDEFHIPPDSARFRIHLDDAAHFIGAARRQFDVLLVDGYTRLGIPASLASERFYEDCRDALRDDGIMVLNLYCRDADEHMERIRRIFGAAVFAVEEHDGTNRVVFACKGHCHRNASPLQRPAGLGHSAWSLLEPALTQVAAAMRKPGSAPAI